MEVDKVTLIDVLTVVAIVLSPLVAVLVSMWLQDRKEKRHRQYWVFATIVSNRHQKTTADVVQALNTIDIAFANDRTVRELWKDYLEIAELDMSKASAAKRLEDKYVEMIHAMGRSLGLGDQVSQLQMSQIYFPVGLGNQLLQGQDIMDHALRVLKGEQALLVAVAPPSDESRAQIEPPHEDTSSE